MTFRATSLSPFARFRLLIANRLGAYNGLSRPTIANHDSYGSTLFYRDEKISRDVYPDI